MLLKDGRIGALIWRMPVYMLVKAVADGHPGRKGVRSQLQHCN
jgi:hypothetical protein